MTSNHTSGRRILIVDDEPLVNETLRMLLQIEGHTVNVASSAQDALSVFEPGKFDLVITDFFMPKMTGDRLAAEIKTLDPRQPVVLSTAYVERLGGSGAPQMVADLIVAKPFEIESLRKAIDRLTAP